MTPPRNPCPQTPSGKHRWMWAIGDGQTHTCSKCGAVGLLDGQGIVRSLLTPATSA